MLTKRNQETAGKQTVDMITPTDWASAWCVRKSNHHVQYNIWEALISTEKPKNVGPDTWRIQIIPPQGKTNFKLCLWGEYKPRAASITEVWNEEEITVINRKTLFLSKRSIQAVKNKEELWRASVCSEDLCWETFCQHVHYRSFVSCDKLLIRVKTLFHSWREAATCCSVTKHQNKTRSETQTDAKIIWIILI